MGEKWQIKIRRAYSPLADRWDNDFIIDFIQHSKLCIQVIQRCWTICASSTAWRIWNVFFCDDPAASNWNLASAKCAGLGWKLFPNAGFGGSSTLEAIVSLSLPNFQQEQNKKKNDVTELVMLSDENHWWGICWNGTAWFKDLESVLDYHVIFSDKKQRWMTFVHSCFSSHVMLWSRNN